MTDKPAPSFHEAIALSCAAALNWKGDLDEERSEATVILAMPEMQAIRRALFDSFHPAKWVTILGSVPQHRNALRSAGLPESVIDWVVPLSSTPEPTISLNTEEETTKEQT